jgi:hypothetical protein
MDHGLARLAGAYNGPTHPVRAGFSLVVLNLKRLKIGAN